MVKFKIFVLILFFLILYKIDAQNFRFGWNIGNLNIYGDAINKEFNGDINFLHFNWIFNKFTVGFNILDIYDYNNIENNIFKYSFLPIKLAYVPFSYNDFLFLSIYGKTGWQITENVNNNTDHGFYGAIGIQFFIFPELKYNYSIYLSLFSEYDTHNKLKIGLSIDLGSLIYGILLGWKETKEKEYYERIEGRIK
jgi:hypothetical protein